MFIGIDVSDCQGDINWKLVKKDGVQFAILRSVRGSGKTDYKFAQNVKGCKEVGMAFDVYKYSYADTIVKAQNEARLVVAALAANAVKDITVWWDMEDASLRPVGRDNLTKLINTAKVIIEAAGFKFGVYCNWDWYNNVLNVSKFTVPFWIAKYPSNAIVGTKTIPNIAKRPTVLPQHELFGWQFSSKGRVAGINGNVDLNVIYLDIEKPNTSKAPEGIVVKKNPYPVPTYKLYRGRLKQNPLYVKWLQFELGFAEDDIDGDFGIYTETKFKEWQARHPKTYTTKKPDGECGVKSVASLLAE